MWQIEVAILVILLIVLFVVCFRTSVLEGDIVYDMTKTGEIKIKNDRMRINASLTSELNPDPNTSLKHVTPKIVAVQKLLDIYGVTNLRIESNTYPEWEYEKSQRKPKGYRAKTTISCEIKINDSDSTLKAGKLQNELSAMSSKDAKVTIDSIDYFISDEQRLKLEGEALKQAIEKGNADAEILLNSTYPNRSYQITNITVRESNSYGFNMAYQARGLPETSQTGTISQGDSTIRVTIDMKIRII